MTRKSKAPGPAAVKKAVKPAAKAAPREPPPLPAYDAGEADEAGEAGEIEEGHDRIVTRPDGYYWRALDGHQEVGPFDTLAEAQADLEAGDEPAWVPGETLAEAEHEIGISDWIDPETGQPAEGQAPPHLERE